LAGKAQAEVITFDDLSDGGNGTPISNGYAGLNWNNFIVLNTQLDTDPAGYQNGVVSLPNVAVNGGGHAASFSSTGEFTLASAYVGAGWNDGLSVVVLGKLNGVQLDSTTLTVNTSGSTLETFNWSGINEVDFSSSGGTPNPAFTTGAGTEFYLDNLSVVPEPAGGILLVGTARLLLGRRRAAGVKNG
jgi:hypothetical protein